MERVGMSSSNCHQASSQLVATKAILTGWQVGRSRDRDLYMSLATGHGRLVFGEGRLQPKFWPGRSDTKLISGNKFSAHRSCIKRR